MSWDKSIGSLLEQDTGGAGGSGFGDILSQLQSNPDTSKYLDGLDYKDGGKVVSYIKENPALTNSAKGLMDAKNKGGLPKETIIGLGSLIGGAVGACFGGIGAPVGAAIGAALAYIVVGVLDLLKFKKAPNTPYSLCNDAFYEADKRIACAVTLDNFTEKIVNEIVEYCYELGRKDMEGSWIVQQAKNLSLPQFKTAFLHATIWGADGGFLGSMKHLLGTKKGSEHPWGLLGRENVLENTQFRSLADKYRHGVTFLGCVKMGSPDPDRVQQIGNDSVKNWKYLQQILNSPDTLGSYQPENDDLFLGVEKPKAFYMYGGLALSAAGAGYSKFKYD